MGTQGKLKSSWPIQRVAKGINMKLWTQGLSIFSFLRETERGESYVKFPNFKNTM